ncbi:TRAP transporter small permease [Paracoccus zeaxanthinifaciens]|uniref:TRAP transporter small permease n=1 Tax=Paracoccus zeaxanthinifaciens TaxID=187400 RepID=UPI0003B2EFBB|nr:TRAP transporter small permease [Paracoccus zeaxanthinifaciens]
MIRIDGVIRPLSWINERVLKAGRAVGIAAVAVMVAVTILQVFCRYVLGSALAWPDEAARFCMLWMTGLMAPTAMRRGGFVAIDILPTMLPAFAARVLNLFLLLVSLVVLVVALQIGWSEMTGLGGRFASASLYLPLNLEFSEWYRIPRSWMMASLPVGLVLLISVGVELVLRNIAALMGHDVSLLPESEAETGIQGVD